MSKDEAKRLATYIASELDGVDAIVCAPGTYLRLAWDPESAQLHLDALQALRDSGVAVPPGMIDDLTHWITHVADSP